MSKPLDTRLKRLRFRDQPIQDPSIGVVEPLVPWPSAKFFSHEEVSHASVSDSRAERLLTEMGSMFRIGVGAGIDDDLHLVLSEELDERLNRQV